MAPVLWVARAFRLPIIAAVTALGLSGCMHTSGPVAMVQPQGDLDTMAYGQPSYGQPAYVQTYAPPPRGLFSSSSGIADSGGALAALRASFAAPRGPVYSSAPIVYPAAPVVYAAAPAPVTYDVAYRLDAGDKLRVVIYGQDGLTNTYAIGASGSITMPLIGAVPARGRTPSELASEITGRLRNGYIRDPSVAVEIESYRPFFILGEVAAPGQYPYVPNMTVESAVAIAGGFSPRARRDRVTVTHTDASGSGRFVVPLGTSLGPGDTIFVSERWF
jgi:polysaccharide export outer membrane protein